jgi:hypothetical protein
LEDVVDVLFGDVEDGWVAFGYDPSSVDADQSHEADQSVAKVGATLKSVNSTTPSTRSFGRSVTHRINATPPPAGVADANKTLIFLDLICLTSAMNLLQSCGLVVCSYPTRPAILIRPPASTKTSWVFGSVPTLTALWIAG